MRFAGLFVPFLLLNLSKSMSVPPVLMTAIEEELQEITSSDDELVFAHVVSVKFGIWIFCHFFGEIRRRK